MKKTAFVLMLLAVVLALSGCSVNISVSDHYASYDPDTKTLKIPLTVDLGDSNFGLKEARMYYTKDASQKEALGDINGSYITIQKVIVDNGGTLDLSDNTTIGDYNAVNREAVDASGFYPVAVVDHVDLQDGDTIFYKIYLEGTIIGWLWSDIGSYTYRDPGLVSHPVTGDTSSLLRFVTLLSVSVLALCVMSLRRRKA